MHNASRTQDELLPIGKVHERKKGYQGASYTIWGYTYEVDDELGLAAGGLVLIFEVMSSESVLLL